MTKDELIEKYRDINVDDIDWWDSVYAGFKADMADVGICIERMYFSGFWSQGDGACFEGRVSDWNLFLRSLGYGNPVLIQHATDNWSFSVGHSGYYYHENSTSFDTELITPGGEDDWFIAEYSPYPEGDIRSKAWVAVLNEFDSAKLKDEFKEAFKDHMRHLYRHLEAEYDYLTSDEAVWESLEANDMGETP